MYCKVSSRVNFAPVGEPVLVQPGLALTPAQMDFMTRHGQAISTQNLIQDYFDGTPNCRAEVPIGETRGIDIADVFNAQKTARRNISKAQQSQQVSNPTSK